MSIAVQLVVNDVVVDEKFVIADYCHMQYLVKKLEKTLHIRIQEIKHNEIQWTKEMANKYLIEEIGVKSGDTIYFKSVLEMVTIELLHKQEENNKVMIFGSLSIKRNITHEQFYEILYLTKGFVHPHKLIIETMQGVKLDKKSKDLVKPNEGDFFYILGELIPQTRVEDEEEEEIIESKEESNEENV